MTGPFAEASSDPAIPAVDVGDVVELDVDRMAVGGAGVAHAADGRVTFVEGVVAGDRCRAQVTEVHKRHLGAVAVDITAPSSDRVEPPCPVARRGCGGCGWQHIDHPVQLRHKVSMVTDALVRIGRLTDPVVEASPIALAPSAHRTTVRALVDADGRVGFRRAHSHDHVAVGSDGCLVTHPLVDEILRSARFPGASEVTVRCGTTSGERLVWLDADIDPIGLGDDVVVASPSRPGHLHETVAGHRFRVSATSFFQARPDGAAVLIHEVDRALGDAGQGGTLLDLYSGVGLFSAVVGSPAQVVAVERSASSAADARHNLVHRHAEVIEASVEQTSLPAASAVIADPARAGLGKKGVASLVAAGAERVALVSCDAGSLGRDAGLLAAAGYRLERSMVVDLFPHTPHVEVVSSFRAR